MSEQAFHDSWWLFTRARGTGLALRLAVVLSPVLALVCTRAASSHTPVAIEVFVVLFTLWCFVLPDSHVGMLVVMLVAVDWLVAVDRTSSPWTLAVALLLLVFHTAMSAASIAAPSAVWSAAMQRRWLRRTGVLALACAGVWLLVAVLDGHEVGTSSTLVVAAFVVLAVGGLWVGDVTLDRRRLAAPPRSSQTER